MSNNRKIFDKVCLPPINLFDFERTTQKEKDTKRRDKDKDKEKEKDERKPKNKRLCTKCMSFDGAALQKHIETFHGRNANLNYEALCKCSLCIKSVSLNLVMLFRTHI